MFTTYLIIVFIFGLIIGSFLNVVIFRIDELNTILFTRSHCQSCKKTLRWYDLIPFISFVLLRAKCRYCGSSISWQYPIVELSTALLFLILFIYFGFSSTFFFLILTFSILLVIFVYDLKTQTVPEILVWIALALSFFGSWIFGLNTITNLIFAGLISGGFLWALVWFSKEKWMGAGDIKIGFILGFLTGYPTVLVALFLAFLIGSVFGLVAIYLKNRKIDKIALKESLPFAPFLIGSTLITILYGSQILDWYLNVSMLY